MHNNLCWINLVEWRKKSDLEVPLVEHEEVTTKFDFRYIGIIAVP